MPHPDLPTAAQMAANPPRRLTQPGPHHQHYRTANKLWHVEISPGPFAFVRLWHRATRPTDPDNTTDHDLHPTLLVHLPSAQNSTLWRDVKHRGQLRLALRAALEQAGPAPWQS